MDFSLKLQDSENLSAANQELTDNTVSQTEQVVQDSNPAELKFSLPEEKAPLGDLNDLKIVETEVKIVETVNDQIKTDQPKSTQESEVDLGGNQIEPQHCEMPIEINPSTNIADSIEEIRTPVDLSIEKGNSEKVITRVEGGEAIRIDQNRHNLFNSREQAVISLDGVPVAKSLKNTNSELKKDIGFTVNSELQNMQLDLLRTNIYYTKKLYEELHDLKVSIKLQSYFKYLVSGVVMLSIVVSSYYAMKLFSGLFSGTGFGDFFAGLVGQNAGIQANLFGNPVPSGGENLLKGTNLETLKNTLEQVPDAYKEKLSGVVKNFLK